MVTRKIVPTITNADKIMSAVNFVLAILFPPLSIYFREGIGMALFVNILLTLLGWIPGSIHAIWFLSNQAEQAKT